MVECDIKNFNSNEKRLLPSESFFFSPVFQKFYLVTLMIAVVVSLSSVSGALIFIRPAAVCSIV